MNKILAYIRRKLSVRVSIWVVMFAAFIFIAALGFLFYQSREAVRQEAISHATQILDKTSLRVEGILNRAEVATQMTEWLIQRHPDKADSMFVYSHGMLLNNPDFYTCSIAFEPYYFNQYGRYFSAYSKHVGDSIRTLQGGSDYYEKHPDQARRFAQASRKGWEWAAEHPEETLDIVMQYVDRENIATNRIMQRLMLKEVLRLQIDRESKKREFRLRPDMVRQASRLMFQNHMLSREVTYQELIPKK